MKRFLDEPNPIHLYFSGTKDIFKPLLLIIILYTFSILFFLQ